MKTTAMPYIEVTAPKRAGAGRWALPLLAAAGWLVAALLCVAADRLQASAANAQERAGQAEATAGAWRRKAGRAYTEYLHAEAQGGSVIRVPLGATFDCVDTNKGRRCDMTTVFPPANY